jgi:hypothetical protein
MHNAGYNNKDIYECCVFCAVSNFHFRKNLYNIVYSGASILQKVQSTPRTTVSTLIPTNLHSYLSTAQYWAVPQQRRLVAGFSPQRPRFASRTVRVRFVVDNVPLG